MLNLLLKFPKNYLFFFFFLCLSGFSFFALFSEENFFEGVEKTSPLKNRSSIDEAKAVQKSFHKIFELYKTKVVFISTEKNIKIPGNPFTNDPRFQRFFGPTPKRTKKISGLGTGFLISEDGHICTNYHVVAKTNRVTVRIDRKEFSAKVIGTDTVTDLALLKIENAREFKPVYFGDSDKVQVGDWAIAIGNPFGFDKTFTVGVVSAIRREREKLDNAYIQTDASINQGNSGGPLINLHGEVIGVNRMIYSKSGGSLGIGFSIPINIVKDILNQLYKYGKAKWGYIGVKPAKLTRNLSRRLGATSTRGALVVKVKKGSPAAKAKLLRGDIILRVDNKLVNHTNDLHTIVSRLRIGKRVKFEIFRNKKKKNIFIKIAEKPR